MIVRPSVCPHLFVSKHCELGYAVNLLYLYIVVVAYQWAWLYWTHGAPLNTSFTVVGARSQTVYIRRRQSDVKVC